MDSQAEFDELLLKIYGAVLAPAQWEHAWHAVARHAGAEGFHFFSLDLLTGLPDFGLVSHWPEALVEYDQYYGRIDPRREIVSALAPGELFVCHEHIDERFAARNEYYQDFLMRYDARYALGGSLRRTTSNDTFFALMRSAAQGAFAPEEIRRTRRLIPHLRQAVDLFHHTTRLREVAALGEAGFDALETGLIATDARGRIVYVNAQGEALLKLGGGIVSKHGVLAATDPADDSQLAGAIRQTATSGTPRSIKINGSASRGFLHLTVIRLGASHTLFSTHPSTRLLILLGTSGARRVLTGYQLMQLFGLTAAEARLARALAQGQTPEQYAAEQSLKMATVRAQLRATYPKIGVHRQADLVRLLATIPVAR